MGSIHEKNQRSTISCNCTFKEKHEVVKVCVRFYLSFTERPITGIIIIWCLSLRTICCLFIVGSLNVFRLNP
jgi:hypothetical protein